MYRYIHFLSNRNNISGILRKQFGLHGHLFVTRLCVGFSSKRGLDRDILAKRGLPHNDKCVLCNVAAEEDLSFEKSTSIHGMHGGKYYLGVVVRLGRVLSVCSDHKSLHS